MFLTSLVALIFVLGVLILVHELGHFIAAKAMGVEVIRFSLGLGPRLIGIRVGETDYCLSAIPWGGYVKMAGEETAAALEGGKEVRPPSPRDFDQKPLAARFLVISAGVAMNVLWAFVLYSLLLYVQGVPVTPSTTLEAVKTEALQGVSGGERLQPGVTILSVNRRPVETWEELVEAVWQAPSESVSVTLADQASPVVIRPATQEVKVRLIGALTVRLEPRVGRVKTGSPAAEAGLQPGDLILAVNQEPVESWSQVVERIRTGEGRSLELTILRGADRLSLTAVPGWVTVPEPHFELGIGPWQRTVELSPGEAILLGGEQTLFYVLATLKGLALLVTGQVSLRSIGGPIMVGQFAGYTLGWGWGALLSFMALLSINLAVINFLPIPILDGGHFLFLVVEAVRGRALTPQQRLRLTQVGLFVVVLLMVWAIMSDLLRLVGV